MPNDFELRVLNAMQALKGCTFATLAYTTSCGFPKKSGLDKVEKCVTIKGAQLNYDYENAVNNRAEKATGAPVNFKAGSLPFGAWVQGLENKVIEHKGAYYLRFYTQKNSHTSVEYIENGQPCDQARVAQIKAYLATKGQSVSGTQAAVGLTDNQVEPKALTISKLHYLTFNGTTISNDQVGQAAG